ncbi:MAG TPA: hypothetical protein VGD60_10090 [Candidatus Acidoferrales bacterium]
MRIRTPDQAVQASPKKLTLSRLALTIFALSLFCVHSARADAWSAGALTTYNQADYGNVGSTSQMILFNNYDNLYASNGDIFEVGIASPGYFMEFSNDVALGGFLPAEGYAGALTGNLANPSSSPSGIFGGEVVALKLNIDLSAAGFLPGTSGLDFGNLILTGLTGSQSGLNNATASQILALDNMALGGANTGYSIADLLAVTANLNDSFVPSIDEHGSETQSPSQFAQNNLIAPAGSTAPMPEPPTLLLAVVGIFATAIFRKRRALVSAEPQ